MLTHTPDVDVSLCAIRLSSAQLAIQIGQAKSDGRLFAWMARIVNLKNCVAEKAVTDASFAFATPTEETVFPAGIARG